MIWVKGPRELLDKAGPFLKKLGLARSHTGEGEWFTDPDMNPDYFAPKLRVFVKQFNTENTQDKTATSIAARFMAAYNPYRTHTHLPGSHRDKEWDENVIAPRRVPQGKISYSTEDDGYGHFTVYVQGPLTSMEYLIPDLKKMGFTEKHKDSKDTIWERPDEGRNLKFWGDNEEMALHFLIEDLEKELKVPEAPEPPQHREPPKDEITQRFEQNLCISIPFSLKDEAKHLGGRWDQARKLWCMPDKRSLEKLQEIQAGLCVKIPYEYKDEAKKLGGSWNPTERKWCLPSPEAVEKLLAIIHAGSSQKVASLYLSR